MNLETEVRYLTNADGQRTDVLLGIDLWHKIVQAIVDQSGLDSTDELEDNQSILKDLRSAFLEVKEGKTYSIDDIWDNLDS